MFWDIFIAVGVGLSQLAITIYGVVISVKEKRIRTAVVICIVGILGIALTVIGTIRNGNIQDKLQNDLASIKRNLSGAKVGLVTIKIQPDPQELVPDKDFLIGLAFGVFEGTAKNMRCFLDAFTLAGQESGEQNRQAKSKFNQTVAREDSGTGEDRVSGTYCFKGILVRMNKQEIKEAIAAKRIVYAMGHVQWKNESGADFHTDTCKWMEPPKTNIVRDPGWHDCN